MTSGGTPVLHSLEEFYGAPIADVAKQLGGTLTELGPDATIAEQLNALRCGEFLELYLHQTQSIPVEEWLEGLDLEAGSLRASLIGRELATTPGRDRRSVLMDGELLGRDHLPMEGLPPRQVKAALCYATEVLAEDPFDEEQDLHEFIRSAEQNIGPSDLTIAPNPSHFVSTVEAIAALGPVIRAGYLKFVPRRASMAGNLIGAFASNAWDNALLSETERARRRAEELSKRTFRLWLATGGAVTPLFADDSEESAFRAEAGLFAQIVDDGEAVRLRQLARLALPTAGHLVPAEMVVLREDDALATFRVRQRQALAAAGSGASDEAIRVFQEEMASAARDLKARVHSSALQGLLTRTIGWGMGAMVLAPAGLQAVVAALGGIASQTLIELVLKRPGSSTQALYHHYAVLGGVKRVPTRRTVAARSSG